MGIALPWRRQPGDDANRSPSPSISGGESDDAQLIPSPVTATLETTQKEGFVSDDDHKPQVSDEEYEEEPLRKKQKQPEQNTALNSEETVLMTPVLKSGEEMDDLPDMKICLSKFHKSEIVELSEDRLTAGNCLGYRMVRATRGVSEGAWYFEIKVLNLGETGHTRLGWSTDKGNLEAPVGFDAYGYGYRDIDGCKIHKSIRNKYGEEGYSEGDVIGFYINLPEGNLYDSNTDVKEIVPGSEISFYKNGVCQGVAFSDLYGGRYYPAASMYTHPKQPNCVVRFNFGPDFECFPVDFEGRPIPSPMIEIPYQGSAIIRQKPRLNFVPYMYPVGI